MGLSTYTYAPIVGTKEHYLLVTPENSRHFSDQLQSIFNLYQQGLKDLNLDLDSGISITFYISDAANHEDYLRNTNFFKELLEAKIAVSVVQLPSDSFKIVLLAYHIKSDITTTKIPIVIDRFQSNQSGLLVSRRNIEQIYLKQCLSAKSGTASEQTLDLLEGLDRYCKNEGLSLENVIRTWFYIHDIDNNYAGISSTRTNFFNSCNLNHEARFPASTGIEGRTKNHKDLISMDAIIINGIHKKQVKKMQALTNMNSTIEYNVTFERGIEVAYGDRKHFYISGTASISNNGTILHEGDVIKQAARTLENINALLRNHDSNLNDMAYMIVYLRDITDYDTVNTYLKEAISKNTPYLIMFGNVCRPGWLIEIEGVAISSKGNREYPAF